MNHVNLTEEGNTQDTPTKVKSNSHKTLVFEQWRSKWSMVSSFSRHIKHLFAKDHPLFWTRFRVKVLPQAASHAKKLILGCTHTSHMQLDGNKTGQSASSARYRDLAQNFLLFDSFQTTISSTSSSTLFPWRRSKKISASSTSQSFRALEKQGFQPPQPPSARGSHTSATQASFSANKAKREGKDSHKGESPHHLSLQNLTLFPLSTLT